MGVRINTIMQTCFFAISGVLPREEAIYQIKKSIEKTYGKKGEAVVKKNFEAVDETLAHLYEVKVPDTVDSTYAMPPTVSEDAPDFVKKVTAVMMSGHGDLLPVSAFPVDGTCPWAPPSGRSATSPSRSPRGTRRSASSATSASSSAPTPPSGPRSTTRPSSPGLPRVSCPWTTRGRSTRARSTPCRWPPRTARAALSA